MDATAPVSYTHLDVYKRQLLNESPWEQWRSERYASFDSGAGKDFESGKLSLADLHALALTQGEPKQVSGKQERYENLLNQYLQR